MGVEVNFVCYDCKRSSYCGKNVSQRMNTVLKHCVENHKFDTIGTDHTHESNGKLMVESSTGYDVLIPDYYNYERFNLDT